MAIAARAGHHEPEITGRIHQPFRNRPPPAPGRAYGQMHRFFSGTLASTWSACWPQPLQVIFPHRPQTAGLHMKVSPFR